MIESTLQDTYDTVMQRNPGEPEFHQAVKEVLESLEHSAGGPPSTTASSCGCASRSVSSSSRVPWVDDEGTVQINRGFHVSTTPRWARTRAGCASTRR